jgi:predicted alpha/beta-fold hydrolase
VQPGCDRVSDASYEPPNQPELDLAPPTEFANSVRAPVFAVDAFVPRRFLRNRHLQTIAGNFLSREDRLPAPEAELVEVAPAMDSHASTRVLCHCHWQPSPVRSAAPTAILLHGLEGSSNSQYIVGNANKLWRAGANIIRMNMRNCGGTEQLSASLYHSGLSGDVAAVMQHFVARESLESVALVGYSMGGNLVLKLAGDLGAQSPKYLRAVVGISPAIDLGPSAAALHRPENRLYERRFLRALLKRFRLKASLFPQLFDLKRAEGIRSLWEFDHRITAAYAGFASADDYYYRAAAARVIRDIAVPTLIIHSSDDPFVTLTPPTISDIQANPNITFVQTAHGGHCAFLADPKGEDDGYWAEAMLLRFILAHA